MGTAQNEPSDEMDLAGALGQNVAERLDAIGGDTGLDGISRGQHLILSIVEKDGPMSIGIVARLAGASASTVSEISRRLLERGLIAKTRGPYDGRVVVVELTDTGRRQVEARRAQRRRALDGFLRELSPEERTSFEASLETACRLLERADV